MFLSLVMHAHILMTDTHHERHVVYVSCSEVSHLSGDHIILVEKQRVVRKKNRLHNTAFHRTPKLLISKGMQGLQLWSYKDGSWSQAKLLSYSSCESQVGTHLKARPGISQDPAM